MKIERLETHDRLLHFKKDQEANIFLGAEDCLKRNPFSVRLQDKSSYIYMFAHPRTAEDGVTKRMIWQPRLSRPKAQTNSYLFRAKSGTDLIEVCWLLPPREMWSQYQKDKVTESELILWSIDMFENKREELEKPNIEDISDEKGAIIYTEVLLEMQKENRIIKPDFSVAF